MNDINLLQPYVAYLCRKFLQKCNDQGLDVKVIETVRTQERQTELHNENPANPALLGPHGFGLAFDAAPLKNNTIDWKDYALFKKMGEVGKSLGLEWGGDWKKVDCPHFQFVQGLKDSEIRAGKLPKFPPLPLEAQYQVYAGKLMGNGLSEEYAQFKSIQLKEQGYTDIYYIKPDGTKINY